MSVSQDDSTVPSSIKLLRMSDCVSPVLCCVPRDIFGEDCVSVKDGSVLSVTVDGRTANLNLETRV